MRQMFIKLYKLEQIINNIASNNKDKSSISNELSLGKIRNIIANLAHSGGED